MARMVRCSVLGEDAEGLEHPPYPGPMGQRIYESVSREGWQRWLAQQTMLINEHRLSLIDPKARRFLEDEMRKFLFEGGAEPPQGYVPPEKS